VLQNEKESNILDVCPEGMEKLSFHLVYFYKVVLESLALLLRHLQRGVRAQLSTSAVIFRGRN